MSPVWLVAYDFSEGAAEIVEKAAQEIKTLGGTLHLVHVVYPNVSPSSFEPLSHQSEANAQAKIDTVAQDLAARFGVREVRGVVREGDAADEIIAVAKNINADRIVIGTHGRRGVGRALMGSVAERVVRLSPVSVLVIKK